MPEWPARQIRKQTPRRMADKQKRNVTVRELAKAAGVSIGTVSRALRGQPGLSAQTRADVLRVAQELGYDTGKLHTGKPKRILFLYNRVIGALTTNQFYSIVLHGAETACREAGVQLSLMSVAPGDDVASKVRRFESDALLSAGYFDSETLAAIRECELPLCSWTTSSPAPTASTTTTCTAPGWPPSTCSMAARSGPRPSSAP
jgi:DNA-binding LacI/PurR family transcriptional regulator